jgi:hypothetical protein
MLSKCLTLAISVILCTTVFGKVGAEYTKLGSSVAQAVSKGTTSSR